MDRLRKIGKKTANIRVIHIDVLGLLAILAIAMNVWLLTRLTYQINTEKSDRVKAIADNIKARFDDCVEGNSLREALTYVIEANRASRPEILRTLHITPSSKLLYQQRKIEEFQLSAFKSRNCKQYATRAKKGSITYALKKQTVLPNLGVLGTRSHRGYNGR